MTIKKGNQATIRVAGKPIAMTNEPMSTTDNRLYIVSDTSKRVWDWQLPTVVYVDGSQVPYSDYKIYKASGMIRFSKPQSPDAVVTVDGAYVTTSKLALVNGFSLDVAKETYDITSYEDEYKRTGVGIKSASGSFTSFDVLNQALLDSLNSDYMLLEFANDYTDLANAYVWRSWVVISSTSLQAGISDAQTMDISYESIGDFYQN